MNVPEKLVIPSLQNRVSFEEWRTRVDLAACYRLVAQTGSNQPFLSDLSLQSCCRVKSHMCNIDAPHHRKSLTIFVRSLKNHG